MALPVSTFSEILRSIDPVTNPHQDITYGLNISLAQTQFTHVAKCLDQYGVRKRSRQLLRAVELVITARLNGDKPLLVGDFEVLFRCAGAASDIDAAIRAFGMMSKRGHAARRNTSTWVEFLKARFLVDPQYYQWDRARVVVNARQMYSNKEQFEPKAVWKMERIRLGRNALLVWPFSRTPGKERQELRMRLRQKRGRGSSHEHWMRSKMYGVLLNEELLCASMVVFARSGSWVSIKSIILRRGFRIICKEDDKTGEVTVVGGKRFRKGSPREPTARLLNAIVESFGCMSRIQTGLKLLLYVSNKYEIPIPQATWSSLLSWAYVCASKPTSTMSRLRGNYPVNRTTYKNVLEIWEMMTSEPYNIQPSIDDYSCYIKALIQGHRLKEAIEVIREEVVPHYRQLEKEHFQIIAADILKSRKRASYERLQMETLKEHTWFHIQSWFSKILKVASSNKPFRNKVFMQVHVPSLIHEFSDFFHPEVTYRTALGHVRLQRPNVVKRFDWVQETRRTLPQAVGGMVMESLYRKHGLDRADPKLEWRNVRQIKLQRWRREVRRRVRVKGEPPQAGDVNARQWWRTLEEELMT